MKQEKDFLREMFERVSQKISRPYKMLAEFEEILRKNWYDTPESIQALKDQQFEKMEIPLRVVQAIREQLTSATKQNNNSNNSQPDPFKETKSQMTSNKTKKLTEKQMMKISQKLEDGLLLKYPWVGQEKVMIMDVLVKIIRNVANDPYQLKYRTLKKSNNKIREMIIEIQPVLTFLKKVGFEEDEESVFIDCIETHEFLFLVDCLEAVHYNYAKQAQILPQPPKQQEKRFLSMDIKFPQASKDKEVDKFMQNVNLEESNYKDLLDRLVKFRERVMQAAPARRVKIYHSKLDFKQNKFQEVCLETQFSKSDDKMIMQYWKEIRTKKNNPSFQSKRKLEFDFLIKQQIFKQSLIKIKLPNEIIISAWFGPLETLQSVFDLVAEIVIGDLYLYVAPPVKKLDKEMKKTMVALDCVPTGTFYCGMNGDWYIKKEYFDQIVK